METGEKKNSNFLAMSILVAALIIGGSSIYSASIKGGNPSNNVGNVAINAGNDNGQPTIVNVSEDDDVILGDKDAPVTMIVFGDFQCPYCKRLFDESEGRLRDEYVATGKLKVVYRDFPLRSIHPYAQPSAEAAECAKEQGKYWAYHDELFRRQDTLATIDYGSLAAELGLDKAKFNKCVAEGRYKDEIEKDYQDGIAAGVQGTPASFINGKFISGAQPYEAFKAAIEETLNS
ncbi:MAG: hypothetical protein COU07_03050 [Candidatus Harrisonbacteria bacterium CG10_big_fil_rev_8_21_14_0_10_40_38]|uniref:Thioredoxin domain-containing protein n=1 Tax=Candidatus Harrisonbacteria bacterium CG10_big_fil_rev_8_21_14_0_10_40_38 TaxID=1974583 RepID=A0A2H0URK9_9BACT|nr:MAG: hypothetical protein COU07_03050 [Candidatus Harrisonbacteria bacterium CG10_big_fil_rev_8_21_14_0_10_40_38]